MESDLSDYLSAFGESRKPLKLTGDLMLPIELNTEGVIENWKPGNGSGDSGSAE